jgi:uracil-DNA glycosylase family protein
MPSLSQRHSDGILRGAIDGFVALAGEQPGDYQHREGRPFVGPAGKLLDRAFAEIGLDRASVYITNAVKHFKNEPRGKRGLHKRPDRDEIIACRWWLNRELATLKPSFVVALGATAAFALMGRTVVLSRERGRLLHWSDGRAGLATIHPSAILRIRESDERDEAFGAFANDLREATRLAIAA